MPIKQYFLAACLFLPITFSAHAEEMAHDHGGGIYDMFRVEMDAGANIDGKAVQSWDVRGWIGTDDNKLWLKTEGEHKDTKLETAELWALYSRNISTFWDAQVGLRYDFKPKGTTYAAFGFNGLAPYFFDTEAHFFVSQRGDVTARLREENDFLVTQKLILQPYVEVNLSAQKVEAQDIGSGVSDGKVGLQTRYEFTRKFAPYMDIHYGRKFGETSSLAQGKGESTEETVASIGLRLMF